MDLSVQKVEAIRPMLILGYTLSVYYEDSNLMQPFVEMLPQTDTQFTNNNKSTEAHET